MKLHLCLWFFLVSSIFVSLAMGDHHVEEGSTSSEEAVVCDPACQATAYCVAVDNATECHNRTLGKNGRAYDFVAEVEGSAIEEIPVCEPACGTKKICVQVDNATECHNRTLGKNGRAYDFVAEVEGSAIEEIPVCEPACGTKKICVQVDNATECHNRTLGKNGRAYDFVAEVEGSAIEEIPVCEPACGTKKICVQVNSNTTACRVNVTSSRGGRMGIEEVIETSDMNDACSPNPCAGDCVCQLSCKHELGYQCVSEAGFIGKNCDIAIPVVSCGESDISISVSDQFYAEFDGGIGNSVFYVSPDYASKDKCTGAITLDGSFRVEIPLPFVDCGTFVSSDPILSAQGIPFENKLWINRDTGADFDMPVPVINFTCVYARDYAVTTALQPIIQQDPVRIGRSGKFSVEFSLCKIDSCPAQCPSYLTVQDYGMYTIGQVIHVNVKVITGQVKPDFVATLEQMFISCSSDPFSSSDVLTIMASGGCQRPNQVFKFGMRSGDESSPQSVCASFQVPKAASCSTIFIHVKVLLCMAGDLISCNDGTANFLCSSAGRKKRSLRSEENVAFATLGPITIIRGSTGRRIEQLYLDGTTQGEFTFQDDILPPVKPTIPKLVPASENFTDYSLVILWVGIATFTVCCVITLSFVLSRAYRSRVILPHQKQADPLNL